jgi:predicted nucleic acid-binding protein
VRLLRGEPAAQAQAARRLFEAAAHGQTILRLPSLVLAEAVCVLDSYYKVDRADIAEALGAVVNLPGVRADEPDVLASALDRYATQRVDFADAYVATLAAESGSGVASLDADIRRLGPVDLPDWDRLGE